LASDFSHVLPGTAKQRFFLMEAPILALIDIELTSETHKQGPALG
jgi:hypothetical protein